MAVPESPRHGLVPPAQSASVSLGLGKVVELHSPVGLGRHLPGFVYLLRTFYTLDFELVFQSLSGT